MVRIAVAGSTGTIGRLITAHVTQAGHTVVPLSRSSGIDLLSGDGLAAALSASLENEPVAAVIDASQCAATDEPDVVSKILQGARNLIAASRSAGVRSLVLLSINGIDDVGLREALPFYEARYQQERLVLELNASTEKNDGDTGTRGIVVRSVQWFEFVLNPAATRVVSDADKSGETFLKVGKWAIQPAAMDSVAQYLVETAVQGHAAGDQGGEPGMVVVAGPERMTLPDMTRRVLHARQDRRRVEEARVTMEAFGTGTLYAPEGAVVLAPKLQEWLDRGQPSKL